MFILKIRLIVCVERCQVSKIKHHTELFTHMLRLHFILIRLTSQTKYCAVLTQWKSVSCRSLEKENQHSNLLTTPTKCKVNNNEPRFNKWCHNKSERSVDNMGLNPVLKMSAFVIKTQFALSRNSLCNELWRSSTLDIPRCFWRSMQSSADQQQIFWTTSVAISQLTHGFRL